MADIDKQLAVSTEKIITKGCKLSRDCNASIGNGKSDTKIDGHKVWSKISLNIRI